MGLFPCDFDPYTSVLVLLQDLTPTPVAISPLQHALHELIGAQVDLALQLLPP
jgi:hypothetical protein